MAVSRAWPVWASGDRDQTWIMPGSMGYDLRGLTMRRRSLDVATLKVRTRKQSSRWASHAWTLSLPTAKPCDRIVSQHFCTLNRPPEVDNRWRCSQRSAICW